MGRDSDATWHTVDMQNGQTPADQDAGRDVGRHRNLSRAAQDHLTQANLFENPRNIIDCRIVHQDTDSKCEPAERHGVDRPSQQAQGDHGIENHHGIEIAIMIVLRQLPIDLRRAIP
jgi:hypothetical protein